MTSTSFVFIMAFLLINVIHGITNARMGLVLVHPTYVMELPIVQKKRRKEGAGVL